MTCVVAVEDPRGAWIGTDSFMGSESFADIMDKPKSFWLGEMCFAYAGDFLPAQVIESMKPPRRRRSSETPEEYLIKVVAPAMRLEIASLPKLPKDQAHSTDFIVAIGTKVWTVQCDQSVIRSRRGCAAIGAGGPSALPFLIASRKMPPRERLEMALGLAEKLSPFVRKPFHVFRAVGAK